MRERHRTKKYNTTANKSIKIAGLAHTNNLSCHLIKAEYSINILHYKLVVASALYIHTYKHKDKCMEEQLATTLKKGAKFIQTTVKRTLFPDDVYLLYF